jgi:hypothetical protein
MSVTPVSQLSYNKPLDKSSKRKILATSALGTSAAFVIISHKQGFRVSKLAKTPVKDWALFKIKEGSLKIEEKEVLALAGGSVAGDLWVVLCSIKKKILMLKLRKL